MELGHHAGDGGPHLTGVALVGLHHLTGLFRGIGVTDRHLTAHSVQLELDIDGAVIVVVTQPQILDDQCLAVLDVDLVGLAQRHAVEEHMAAHTGDIAVLFAVAAEVLIYLGVHGVGDQVLALRVVPELPHLLLQPVKVHRRQQLAGTAGDGLLALQDHLLQILREAPCGLAHHALEVGHHGIRESQCLAPLHDILRGQVVLHHEDGQIAHHLGGGRHLHRVAQHIVDGLIHLLDLLKAVAQTQRLHLWPQVGVLTAGDLVAVDVGGRGFQAVVEALIPQAHIRPVVGQLLHPPQVQPGVPLRSLQGGHQRIQRGLAGKTRQRGAGGIHHIHTGLGGHQQGRHLIAGGVVGMQVDGDADLLLQGGHQLLGGVGLQQAGHILNGQHMGATVLQLLGKVHIVFQSVLILAGIQNVAGVAHGGLQQLILVQHLVHGHLHAGDPVQRVEHTEHVDAPLRRLLDKAADQIVGIVGIAHQIGATQQHLERDVGDLLPQQTQALPRGLVEETVGHVEGGAAPHLQ